MKATGLRIGNYLNYQKYKSVFQGKVTSISLRTIVINNMFSTKYNNENLIPIPLTEDWLLKLGFEVTHKNRYGWFEKKYGCPNGEACLLKINYKSGVISIENLDADLTLPCYGGYQIEYVHQLQNLYFALTGNELEIK